MNDNTATYKFKKFKKVKIVCEYAIQFKDSNAMIDYICQMSSDGICTSMLYTNCGAYQLVITTNREHYKPLRQLNSHCIVFYDKLHIDEIRRNHRLVCKQNAIKKIKNAFKAP